jgi:hypothetical protein
MPEVKARKAKKHYHVLRLKRGQNHRTPVRDKIFSCQDPECWFYTRAYNLIGKRIMCPMCLNDFICDREDLVKAKPHCKECTRGQRAKEKQMEIKAIEEKLSSFLGLK